MDTFEQAFRLLPDTVIITDIYWYVLDFNRATPFEGLRRGRNLKHFMPDCEGEPRDRYPYGDRVFQRTVSPVREGENVMGHVVSLVDITERERLTAARRQKSRELEALTRRLAQANEALMDYVRQAEALNDEQDKLRIARAIHDNDGHAITELNTLSRMCLELRGSDAAACDRLIDEGIALCRRSAQSDFGGQYDSLEALLRAFCDTVPIPVALAMRGEEPPFAAPLYDTIDKICREAVHNTLSHALADQITIEVDMGPEALRLRISDNGRFHGKLEKGFGLRTMEENVSSSGGEIAFETKEGEGFGIVATWRAES